MNKLDTKKCAQVVAALVEGNSIRATVRMTGVAKNTITKLLVELGAACASYLDNNLRNLSCKRVQCDEIWSFIGAKEKNATPELRKRGYTGDVWTWIAMDADTKLVCSFFVGARHSMAAKEFMTDLAGRLANRVQLTTDGHKAYLNAVAGAFENNIDYAMLVKLYGAERPGEARYSPAECVGCKPQPISGDPDPAHISTSYVERQNLTMRMHMRRFTRLTNGFSKKIENHVASLAIHYMHYNFVRIHQTLRISPAMAADVTDHLWSIEEMLELPRSIWSAQKPIKGLI
jgi:IS1 family transposase